jgi:hypothetical protein
MWYTPKIFKIKKAEPQKGIGGSAQETNQYILTKWKLSCFLLVENNE